MIAADSSSLFAYLKGKDGTDLQRLDVVLETGELTLPPAVLTELLSDPTPGAMLIDLLAELELLDTTPGYWQRAGDMRRKLRMMGLKANIADALVAQSCLDHSVALITRDCDFPYFAKHCGLKLA